MAITRKVDQLTALLEPSVRACGFELWGIEFFQQGRHSVLRIYIDSPEGVTVDHCALVSHQVSGVLDVEDPIAGEYVLEVSSPGWDRPLFSVEQFKRFVGTVANIRLAVPVNGRRRFKGRIEQIDDENNVIVKVDDQEFALPFVQIDKANIVPDYE